MGNGCYDVRSRVATLGSIADIGATRFFDALSNIGSVRTHSLEKPLQFSEGAKQLGAIPVATNNSLRQTVSMVKSNPTKILFGIFFVLLIAVLWTHVQPTHPSDVFKRMEVAASVQHALILSSTMAP